ncbi:MAG: hypothetical protein WC595_03545 [Candidatus Nanoarchaeia archaeon]
MTKTIIFDLGGVFFEANWAEINKELSEKINVPIYPPNTKPWDDSRRIREDLYDQKRIFTTSTCLMGLSSLNKLNI